MLNKKNILIGIVLLVVIGSVGIFFTVAHPLAALQAKPTPIPYKAPPRTLEVPIALHRAQSTTVNQAPTTFNPWGIALDEQNGYVWVAEASCEIDPVCTPPPVTMLGQYSLADGSLIREYLEPGGYSSPMFAAVDAKGNVWFSQPSTDAIGEFDPSTTVFTNYKVAKGSDPHDLVFDKNGNLWFSEFLGSSIGFLNTQTHAIVETATPTANSMPYGITKDGNGTIWFAENRRFVEQIGSFTPTTSGKITIAEHAVNAVQPHLLVADKAGNIWFSEAFGGQIGEYVVATGVTNNYIVSAAICPTLINCIGSHISGIAIDKSNNVWFTDSLSGRIGYIVPATGAMHDRTFTPKNLHPHDGLVIDKNNTVWFTEQYGRVLIMWPGAKIPAA
jgi:virginiamycin B lyase